MSNAFVQNVENRMARNFKRRSAFAVSSALLAAAAAAVVPFQSANAAPADDECVLQELPMPADKYFSVVSAMSDDGELMAGQVYAGQDAADNHILKAVTWTCD